MSARGPLILILILLVVLTVAVLAVFLRANEVDHVVYSLDDPYIHMAMARNLVDHGVWGVTSHAFTSSSSSPLWVLMLAGTYLGVGVRDAVPLVLGLVAAVLVLFLADRICRAQGLGSRNRTVVLLAVLLLTPLVPLVMTGMEHGWQVVIDLAFVQAAVAVLVGGSNARPSAWWPRRRRDPLLRLYLLAPVVIGIRYEGAFLLAVVGGLMLLRRRWLSAAVLALLGMVPVIVYALVALDQGWPALPTSILAKAGLPTTGAAAQIVDYLRHGLVTLRHHPDLLVLIAAAAVLFIHRHGRRGVWEEAQLWLLIFIATAALHLQFSQIAADMRYEAYLMALGIVAIGLAAAEPLAELLASIAVRPGRWWPRLALIVLAICLLAPFQARLTRLVSATPRAMGNIYQQQYQMGLFLRDYYRDQAVVANDIGAITYLADIRLIDIVGLASDDILRRRLDGSCNAADIDSAARRQDAVVAVMYADWFVDQYGPLPQHWQPVASWTIPDNIACARATVDFVGLGARSADELSRRLEDFRTRLPAAVSVHRAVPR